MAKRVKASKITKHRKPKAAISRKKTAKSATKKKTGTSKKKSTSTKKKKKKKKPTKSKTAARKKSSTKSTKKKVLNVKSSRLVNRGKPSRTVQTNSRVAAKATKKVHGGTNSRDTGASDLSATTQDPIQYQEEKPLPKTHLQPEELTVFRQLLLAKRQELAGDVQHLSRDDAMNNSEAGADHSTMPIHMAELGSDNWEHEFTLDLIANEQDRIRKIDEALLRIEDRTYGICLATHKRIRRARLRAKPWARYCIEHATAREEGRV